MPSNSNYFKHKRSEMLSVLPDSYNKVLEIGCGEGSFKNNLNPNVEYWGVEEDTKSAQIAEKQTNNILIGNYADQQEFIPGNYFDLIICNDVIEHMDDYLWFLDNIKTKLNENGSLIASIPNVRFLPNLIELLFKKDWQYKDAGILDRTHLRFFTEKSLKRSLNDSGWKILSFNRINRYGSNRIGPKLVFSYVGQLIFGRDSAYMQFAIRANPIKNN